MKKFTELLFVLLFSAALAWGGVTTLLREKDTYSYYENRMLASMPEATEEAVADGSYFSALETYLSDHTALREDLVFFSTNVDIHILKRPVVNDIVVQDSILLPYLEYESISESGLAYYADRLAENLSSIDAAVESYGGIYCYVVIPGQYSYFEDLYPQYLNNRSRYMDRNLELISQALAARDVNFLDLGPTFEALGYPAELSSQVDNHFSAKGAYLAYKTILETINGEYGGDLRVMEEDELTFTSLPNHYLGSRARKIFDLVEFDEQLCIMEPKDPVSFRRYNNGTETPAIINSIPQDSSQDVTYNCYMGGDIAMTRIDTDREELPTVLLYGDSFTNAVESILYLSCDTMYSLDLRHYTEKTVTEFVLETQPDYVICLRDYGVMNNYWHNGSS